MLARAIQHEREHAEHAEANRTHRFLPELRDVARRAAAARELQGRRLSQHCRTLNILSGDGETVDMKAVGDALAQVG